jgi:small GTP-binding protein
LRYVHDFFNDGFQPTLGASFLLKQVTTRYGAANLQIWDTAGSEKYRTFVPMYSRGASVAIVVFDASIKADFGSIESWIQQVRQEIAQEGQIYLLGNKIDLPLAVKEEEIGELAEKYGIQYYFASAKTGQGVTEFFNEVTNGLPKSKFIEEDEKLVVIDDKKEMQCC